MRAFFRSCYHRAAGAKKEQPVSREKINHLMRVRGSWYEWWPTHTHFHFDKMADTASSARWLDIQYDISGIDAQVELMVEWSEAEGTRVPRPHAADQRVAESEFEGLLRTNECVRSDHTAMQSKIEEMICVPAAPPNDVLSRVATFHTSVRRPRDPMRSEWQPSVCQRRSDMKGVAMRTEINGGCVCHMSLFAMKTLHKPWCLRLVSCTMPMQMCIQIRHRHVGRRSATLRTWSVAVRCRR